MITKKTRLRHRLVLPALDYTEDEFEAVNDNLDKVIKQADDQLNNPPPVEEITYG